jgi:rSAM/selenodomain-associated transferase 1
MAKLKRNTLLPCEEHFAVEGSCSLAIMTKAPRSGQVKTRLTPPLTAEEAAALNICFLRDTASAIAGVGEGATGIACYTPVGAEAAYHGIFPANFMLIAQRGTDLSERLIFATQDLLALGFSSVCLIGSDSPIVPASTFAEAVKILSGPNDCVVLGPTHDGGYYLIGLKALHRRMFEEIDWSTGSVLEQTLERAAEIELPVDLLPVAYDVDDSDTLCQLCHELMGANDGREEIIAPATRKFLHDLIAREGRERIWPEKVVA